MFDTEIQHSPSRSRASNDSPRAGEFDSPVERGRRAGRRRSARRDTERFQRDRPFRRDRRDPKKVSRRTPRRARRDEARFPLLPDFDGDADTAVVADDALSLTMATTTANMNVTTKTTTMTMMMTMTTTMMAKECSSCPT